MYLRPKIYKITDNFPYDLLLLADETREAIDKYLPRSEVYVARFADNDIFIGVFCLYRVDVNTVEIKNIAVSEQYQGKGVGGHLLEEACRVALDKHYKEIIVGTGDAGKRQIRFYEKNGFTKYAVRKNFFPDNYEKPIYENGVMLKDMVLLKKILK